MKERLLNGKIEGEEEGFYSCPRCGSDKVYQWRQYYLNVGKQVDSEDYIKCDECGEETAPDNVARNGEVAPRGDPLVHRPAPRLEAERIDLFAQQIERYRAAIQGINIPVVPDIPAPPAFEFPAGVWAYNVILDEAVAEIPDVQGA